MAQPSGGASDVIMFTEDAIDRLEMRPVKSRSTEAESSSEHLRYTVTGQNNEYFLKL